MLRGHYPAYHSPHQPSSPLPVHSFSHFSELGSPTGLGLLAGPGGRPQQRGSHGNRGSDYRKMSAMMMVRPR